MYGLPQLYLEWSSCVRFILENIRSNNHFDHLGMVCPLTIVHQGIVCQQFIAAPSNCWHLTFSSPSFGVCICAQGTQVSHVI